MVVRQPWPVTALAFSKIYNKVKKVLIAIFITTLIIIGINLFIRTDPPENMSITKSEEPVRNIAIGAWTEGLFDAKNQKLQPDKLKEFEELINKKLSIAHYYIGWEILDNTELLKQFEQLRSFGWKPMLNVNPYYFSKCPASDIPLYRAIANGNCDDFLHASGKNLANIKDEFFLVFAWEMNNDNNEWSIPISASKPEDFIAAWRRIHSIFKEEGVTAIDWVFCPNVPEVGVLPYSQFYPGDDYVDWLGLDGYNWGTTQSWSSWVDFSGVFTASYNSITKIAPGKPLMLAEVNTTDKGGDKAGWYKDMFLKQIPYNFPAIKAVVIFNEDKTKQEKVNWKVDITKESLSAFSEAVKPDFYK
jgi:beta-mannanase